MIVLDTDVKNQKSTPAIYSDVLANIPPAGQTGRLFFSTNTNEIYRDTGSAWVVFIGSSGAGGYVTLSTSPQYITATKEWQALQRFIDGIDILGDAVLNIGNSLFNTLQPQINLYNFLGSQYWKFLVDPSGNFSLTNTSSVLTTELSQTGTFSLIGSATPLFRVGPSAGSTYKVEIDGGVNLGVGHNYRINGVNIHNSTNNYFPVLNTATSTFIDSVLSQSGSQIQNIGGTYYASSGASTLNTAVSQIFVTNSTATAIASIGQRTYANVNNVGLAFFTAPSAGSAVQRMTINASGNVGIGVASASTLLELSTDSASKPTTNTWTISSDERVKTDITPYTTGLNEILAINPVKYRYNGKAGYDPTQGGVGIIAQDIKDIIPETVSTYYKFLEEDDEEETELYNFNSHALTFVLINAVKELYLEIQTLKQNG
jgi:hypothetical protein